VQGKCRSNGATKWGEESYFFQSVATGEHTACPPLKGNNPLKMGSLGSKESNGHFTNPDTDEGQDMQKKPFETIGKQRLDI